MRVFMIKMILLYTVAPPIQNESCIPPVWTDLLVQTYKLITHLIANITLINGLVL